MGLSCPDSSNPHRVTGQRPSSWKGWKGLEIQSLLLRLLLKVVNAFGRKSFFRRVTVPRWRKRLCNLSHSDWHKVGCWIKIPHQYVWQAWCFNARVLCFRVCYNLVGVCFCYCYIQAACFIIDIGFFCKFDIFV